VKRFAFRLARLERLRQAARRQARAALALALAEARQREIERRAREAELHEAETCALEPELAGKPWSLRALALWRAGLRRAVLDAAARETQALALAARAEREHAAASREHRVIERLHERRRQAWSEDARRQEQKLLDESHSLLRAREPAAEPEEARG
jgi:hypothetical protein